jgi:channel protein (hemolysin III family)
MEGIGRVAPFESYPIPGFAQPVSSLTHLIGAGLFAGLSFALLRRGCQTCDRLAAFAVYTLSCVLLLSMSGLYHMLPRETAGRAVLARLDHAAIFVLIAGTFTSVLGILLTGRERWVPLVLIWTAAVAGVIFKTIYFTNFPEWAGLIFYLGMAWASVVPGIALWRKFGTAYLRPLIWGGIAYSVGAVLDFTRWPVVIPGVVGPHEVFHLAVLIGISCHWYFVARLVADGPPPARTRPGRTLGNAGGKQIINDHGPDRQCGHGRHAEPNG